MLLTNPINYFAVDGQVYSAVARQDYNTVIDQTEEQKTLQHIIY